MNTTPRRSGSRKRALRCQADRPDRVRQHHRALRARPLGERRRRPLGPEPARQLRLLHERHARALDPLARASESLDVGPDIPYWLEDGFATIRIEVTSAKPVFIGIGPVADVERYLADVEHAQITDFDIDPFAVSYRALHGAAEPGAPASQTFWRAQASGSGRQTISWPVEEGTWSVVAMNADGSRNVSVDAQLGTRIRYLRWIVIGLLAAGVLVLLGGARLIYSGARRPRRGLAAAP
jgi:hypothetical protein